MNLKLAVVGAPKTGKTSFCISFAEYLGAKNLCYTENGPLGKGRGVIMPSQAHRLMVHPGPRCNGVMRSFSVNFLKSNPKRIEFIDTVSLKESIPLPPSERHKLILTLQALQDADAVLYLMDLSCTDPAHIDFAMDVGLRLVDYCRKAAKPLYSLGTKCDLVSSRKRQHNEPILFREKLIPVSSLTRIGFPQLRELLLKEIPLYDV